MNQFNLIDSLSVFVRQVEVLYIFLSDSLGTGLASRLLI